MSEIQDILISKHEKVPKTDDPIALKTSWEPTNPGGANFKTQQLTVTKNRIIIEKTYGTIVLSLIFILIGIPSLIYGSRYYYSKGMVWEGVFAFVIGIIFTICGILVLKFFKKTTFDLIAGVYYRGKKYDKFNSVDRSIQGLLSDIYAIQLIYEILRSGSTKVSNTYKSYEMNLVFKDGERLNIMDHGKQEDTDAAAIKLGEFLQVPVWKASYSNTNSNSQ